MSSALKRYTQKINNKSKNPLGHSHANQGHHSRQGSVISRSPKKKESILSEQNTISYQQKDIHRKYNYTRMRMNSLPVSLPKLQERIAQKQKQALKYIYKKKLESKKYIQIVPMKKFQPIRLMKRPTSSNTQVSYLSMASSRVKLTDQYFSQMDNIRMVQRLLLAQPSKQTSKNQHKQFYKKQEKYRKNIQLSKSNQSKSKKYQNLNKQWNS